MKEIIIKPKVIPEELTEEILIQYADVVDWNYASQFITVNDFSMDFFHRFELDIHWRTFSLATDLNQLSEEFMKHFKHKIGWFNVINNPTITTEFAHKYKEEMGGEFWFHKGKCHREDGPAVIDGAGHQYWYKNGKQHRLDGPAVVMPNDPCFGPNYEEYWVDDLEYDKETFYKKYYKNE